MSIMALGRDAPSHDSDDQQNETGPDAVRLRHTSVATRLGLAAVAVALVSMIVTLGVGLGSGEEVGDELVDERLSAVQGSALIAVASLLADWRSDATILAAGPATADALTAFGDALDGVGAPTERQRSIVTEWYENDFVPQLEIARGAAPPLSAVVPTSPEAIALQAVTIADRSDVDEELDADDISTAGVDGWLAVADEFGPFFELAARRLDVSDVLLVDSSNRVVYSVARGPDLGTDLLSGPYGGSLVARLSIAVRLDPERGVRLGDIAPYEPAVDRPASATAAPVIDASGEVIGAVVAVHDGALLDEVLDVSDSGGRQPLGRTGQNLIVGADGIVRTDSRAHKESPEAFLEVAVETGALDDEGAARVAAIGTTATVLELDSAITGADIDTTADTDDGGGDSGADSPVELTGPLGRRTVAFVSDIDDPDVEWRVASSVALDEVDVSIREYRTDVVRIAAIGLLVLSLLAVAWANRIVRPVRLIGDRLDRDVDPRELAEAVERGPVEFGRLADDFTVMQERLDAQRRDVELADDRRRELLRTLLPPAVQARVEAGDRDVFDRIPSATLIVGVLRGLSQLEEESSLATGRSRFHAVTSALDALCARHSVERIKIVGDSVLVACGHDRPLIDHAPRAVAFAQEAIEAASSAGGSGFRARFAVHTGPISAGLGGGSRLVYDVWGPTVTEVFLLSRSGSDGEIVVSSATLSLLPSDVAGSARAIDEERPELGWSIQAAEVGAAIDARADGAEVS